MQMIVLGIYSQTNEEQRCYLGSLLVPVLLDWTELMYGQQEMEHGRHVKHILYRHGPSPGSKVKILEPFRKFWFILHL